MAIKMYLPSNTDFEWYSKIFVTAVLVDESSLLRKHNVGVPNMISRQTDRCL